MNYAQLINVMKRFGSTEKDICVHNIGILPEEVNENVIIAPWWEPSYMPDLGTAEYLSTSESASEKVWNIHNGETDITYIKTGIGSPCMIDSLLSLGVTKCKRVIFVGSVGSLDRDIGIGDIVIPEYSICGDGASRYIASDSLQDGDVFGEKVFPDSDLYAAVCNHTDEICKQNGVRYHIGRAFSIDTIFAQFAHIDSILNMGCNVIEMETASAFRAAKIAGLSLAAIFSVSDNTVANKSLISGRTDEEQRYRKLVRCTLFPQIILRTFQNNHAK